MSGIRVVDRLTQPLRAFDASRLTRSQLVRDNLRCRRDLWWAHQPPERDTVCHAFLIGCGRSGTTVLGRMLAAHDDVTYAEEQRGRWSIVDHRTDIWARYWPWRGGSLLGSADVDAGRIARFQRIFRCDTPVHLDKSPEHAFMLDFISGLDPKARFIHIVRDGGDVADSIARKAHGSGRIIGDLRYNDWWGLDDAKWKFLTVVARHRGELTDEVARARTDAERGLCEWLLSLREVERHRAVLADRLIEVRYEDLLAEPRAVLAAIAAFLEVDPVDAWLARASSMLAAPEVHPAHPTEDPLLLAALERGRREWCAGGIGRPRRLPSPEPVTPPGAAP